MNYKDGKELDNHLKAKDISNQIMEAANLHRRGVVTDEEYIKVFASIADTLFELIHNVDLGKNND